MQLRKSDFGELDPLVCNARPHVAAYRKWIETICVLAGLVGGGAGVGYYAGTQQSQASHLAEVDRLREAYRDNVYELTAKLNATANTLQSAATQVDAAAATADAAAINAEKAVRQSAKPVKPQAPLIVVMPAPAKPSGTPPLTPVPTSPAQTAPLYSR